MVLLPEPESPVNQMVKPVVSRPSMVPTPPPRWIVSPWRVVVMPPPRVYYAPAVVYRPVPMYRPAPVYYPAAPYGGISIRFNIPF